MGLHYVIPFSDVATGAVADTFKTLAAAQAGDTAGYRFRLRRLAVGPADGAPLDKTVSLQLKRIDDVSAGGAGTKTSVTPEPKDSLQRAAVCTGGENYTAEPTTYNSERLWEIGLNARASVIKEWDPEDAPVANRDQLIGLLAAPQSADAITLSGSLEIEEF